MQKYFFLLLIVTIAEIYPMEFGTDAPQSLDYQVEELLADDNNENNAVDPSVIVECPLTGDEISESEICNYVYINTTNSNRNHINKCMEDHLNAFHPFWNSANTIRKNIDTKRKTPSSDESSRSTEQLVEYNGTQEPLKAFYHRQCAECTTIIYSPFHLPSLKKHYIEKHSTNGITYTKIQRPDPTISYTLTAKCPFYGTTCTFVYNNEKATLEDDARIPELIEYHLRKIHQRSLTLETISNIINIKRQRNNFDTLHNEKYGKKYKTKTFFQQLQNKQSSICPCPICEFQQKQPINNTPLILPPNFTENKDNFIELGQKSALQIYEQLSEMRAADRSCASGHSEAKSEHQTETT